MQTEPYNFFVADAGNRNFRDLSKITVINLINEARNNRITAK